MASVAFLDAALEEWLEQDSLLLVAKGLGSHELLRRLVARSSSAEHLVFVLNATRDDEQLLLHELAGAAQPPVVINNETNAQERMERYLQGGVLLITTRILTVDMLCDRVPAALVSGLIVANAHRTSTNLGFVVRLFRKANGSGFIRALSDDAPAFTNGFSKIEKVMRALFVRRLLLWPRFHLEVSDTLGAAQPEVEEHSIRTAQA